MSGHAAVLATVCANCGAELDGAFCHACGQKATGPDVSLHDFFHDALHEFAHVDGKIIQTVRLLITKPGMLTKEFLSGRRARFISPLRVYLTCSVLFFGLVALTPNPQLSFFHVTYKPSPGDAPLDAAAIQRYEDEATLRASRGGRPRFPARDVRADAGIRSADLGALPEGETVLRGTPVLLDPLSRVCVPRLDVRGRTDSGGGTTISAVTWLAPVAILAYHFISLRRVFGGSRLAAAWKGTLLWIVYLFVIVSTMVAIGLVSVRGTGPGTPQTRSPHLISGIGELVNW